MSERATPDDVRAAYRRLMRTVHPDVAGTNGQSYPHSASAVNEAYRVLVDPSRRFAYDRQLRSTGSAVASSASVPFEHEYVVPPPSRPVMPTKRAPWRAVLGVLVAAAAGVVVLSAVTKPSVPRPPDGVLRAGSCVTIEPNGDAKETTCTGVDDIVMVEMVEFDAPCPQGTVGHRDRQGMGIACLEIAS